MCEDKVRSCTLFVRLLGMRYGSLVPGTERSYTEHEFEVAGENRIPRLMFLLAPDAVSPGIPLSRLGDRHWERQQAFRCRVSDGSGLNVRFFGSPDDLEHQVCLALRAEAARHGSVPALNSVYFVYLRMTP